MKRLSSWMIAASVLGSAPCAYCDPIHLELQSPPTSSRLVSTHPTHPELFANLEQGGEITLWSIDPTEAPTKLLTVSADASAMTLLEAKGKPRETLIAYGTRDGGLELVDGIGGPVCSGRVPSNVSPSPNHQIVSIVAPNSPSLLVTVNENGEIFVWHRDCSFLKMLDRANRKDRLRGLVVVPGRPLLLAAFETGVVAAYDLERDTAIGVVRVTSTQPDIDVDRQGVQAIAVSHDGKRAALVYESKVWLYNTDDIVTELGQAHTAVPLASTKLDRLDRSERVAFSPDGEYLVGTDSLEGTRLWRARPGEIARLVVPRYTPETLAFTSDGNRLITGRDSSPPRIWDFGYSPVGPPIMLDVKPITAISIAASNLVAVATESGAIHFLSPEGLRARPPLARDPGIRAVALSSDASTLLSARNGPDIEVLRGDFIDPILARFGAPKDVGVPPGTHYQEEKLKFLGSGKRFVAASSRSIVDMWDIGVEQPSRQFPLDPPNRTIMDLESSADGNRVLVVLDGLTGGAVRNPSTLVVFGTDGELIARIDDSTPNRSINHAIFLDREGNRIASQSNDGAIQQWSVKTKSIDGPFSVPAPFLVLGSIHSIRGGSALIHATNDGSLREISLIPGTESNHLDLQHDDFGLMFNTSVMEVSPDESLIATGSYLGAVTLWRPGFRSLWQFPEREAGTGRLHVITDGVSLLSCGPAGDRLMCWSTEKGVTPIQESPDLGLAETGAVHRGRMLVATSYKGGKVLITSIRDGTSKVIESSGIHSALVWALDGRRLYKMSFFGALGELQIFNVPEDFGSTSLIDTRKFEEPLRRVTALRDGRIAVEFGNRIEIRDEGNQLLSTIPLPGDCRQIRVESLAFDPDEESVALSCSLHLLGLHKIKGAWHVFFQWLIPSPSIAMSFDVEGNEFVTMQYTGEVNFWDAHTGALHRSLRVGNSALSMAVSGHTMTVTSIGGKATYFSLPSGEVLGSSTPEAGGLTTLSAKGWYASVGNTHYRVVGFARDQRLSDEAVAARFSTAAIEGDLFKRDDLFVQAWSTVERQLELAFSTFMSQSWYEKSLSVLLGIYALFVLGLVFIWLLRPALLCSWTLRLSGSSLLVNAAARQEAEP